ncbi:MAG TPA: hypothetical protein VM597_18535, partial [Gemmataceae bacterium]|nr:hypothetical protein [Gemmataceae bacterium]
MSPVPDPTAEPPAPGAEPTVGRDPADDATRTMDFVGAAGGSAGEYVPDVPGYEIIAEVGRGGMGVVYRAHDRNLGREVALKMVLGGAAAGPGAVNRFLAEAEALA